MGLERAFVTLPVYENEPTEQAESVELRAIVVLTPGRSGSSLVTNFLSKVGVGLSGALIPGRLENPQGFFEDEQVVDIHNRLLADLGASTWMPLPSDWINSSAARRAKEDLSAQLLLNSQANVANGWAVKDPRITNFLPLWMQALNQSAIEPRFVFAIRNPAAVATSLMRTYGMPEARGELLWLSCTVSALEQTAADVFVVHYEDWFDDGLKVGQDLAEYCQAPRVTSEDVKDAIEEILEPQLNRSSWSNFEVSHPLVSSLYETLLDCRGADFDRGRVLHEVREATKLIKGFRPWADLGVRLPKGNRRDGEEATVDRGAPPKPEPRNNQMDVADISEQLRKVVGQYHEALRHLLDSEAETKELRTRLAAVERNSQRPQGIAPKAKASDTHITENARTQELKGRSNPLYSLRYRVGDVLILAVSEPGRNTFAVPVRLWRLAREGFRDRRASRTRK